MTSRKLSIIAGGSYLVIFFTAIFANFYVLEALLADPVGTVTEHGLQVRLGIMAFLAAAVFDVFVAWALYELYKGQALTSASTYFRIIHAAIMALGLSALVTILSLSSSDEILAQVDLFNTIWLIGLFFFGVHLILLGWIVKTIKYIPYVLMLAGVMYIVDTTAHFVVPNYNEYADVFLLLVAVPAILGEMSFSLWLLSKGGKENLL